MKTALLPPPILEKQVCYHCGDACESKPILADEKIFCCEGCRMVYQILSEKDLCTYYDLEKHPGISLKVRKDEHAFAHLDHADIRDKLLSFSNGETAKVTFFLPQVHCSSCVWLLEKLPRLHPSVISARLDFLRKEIHLTFRIDQISLRELVLMLTQIGYEPMIQLSDLRPGARKRNNPGFYLRLGVSGFCFGNIMLFSFPEYLGLEAAAELPFHSFFGYLNLALALPVLLYCARVFFVSALQGLKQRSLNIDVPISVGILVLFGRSAFEILTHTGAGYMDSLAGLVFFLLIGRWFQNKTYDTLSFDRDYTSYFPISGTRKQGGVEESIPVTQLQAGDTILVRSQELIPADALLLSDEARIDYSFVTGEAEPVLKKAGDLIYAGGRQAGGAIELTLVRSVSQSYLTQLWNQDSMGQSRPSLQAMTDRLGRRFTWIIFSIAIVACIFWLLKGETVKAIHVLTSVLIVACPCALALAAPVTLGNSLRLMGKYKFYLKNTDTLERLAALDRLVFDKTGTITYKDSRASAEIQGDLDAEERMGLLSLARQSSHPVSQAIARTLAGTNTYPLSQFEEHTGKGISAWTEEGAQLCLGNAACMQEHGIEVAKHEKGATFFAVDGHIRARISVPKKFREGLGDLITSLGSRYRFSLLSGDNDRDREALTEIFPENTPMHFGQSPQDKLTYIRKLREEGEVVAMVGDGLNDAGALRESDAGIAVTEHVDSFSPACDAILDAGSLNKLGRLLDFSRTSVRLVRLGLIFSLAYNVFGLSVAVQGHLSPLIAAILMPLSSSTIVAFGLISTRIAAQKME